MYAHGFKMTDSPHLLVVALNLYKKYLSINPNDEAAKSNLVILEEYEKEYLKKGWLVPSKSGKEE
jgi:hypothetical protein